MSDPMEAAGFGVVPRWMIYNPQVDAKMIMLFLVLSARASGKGICWPSLETLAKESRLSRSTVHETLTAMRDRGLITWSTRSTPTGRLNFYRLLIDPLGGVIPGGVVQNPDDPSSGEQTTGSPPSGREVEPEEVEPLKDPSSSGDDGEGMTFADWWAMVPRKVGKKAAEKAWAKALKEVSAEALFDGLRAHLPYWEGKTQEHIPHPATWLNEGRWEDRPEVPVAEEHTNPPEGEDPTAWMRRRSE